MIILEAQSGETVTISVALLAIYSTLVLAALISIFGTYKILIEVKRQTISNKEAITEIKDTAKELEKKLDKRDNEFLDKITECTTCDYTTEISNMRSRQDQLDTGLLRLEKKTDTNINKIYDKIDDVAKEFRTSMTALNGTFTQFLITFADKKVNNK